MNLILLDDCGRFAGEYHVIGFDELRVIPVPSPEETSIEGLNNVLSSTLQELPDDKTVIAFTHTWVDPQEMKKILATVEAPCTFLTHQEEEIDIVILTEKPEIPEDESRDFYEVLEAQFDRIDFADVRSATVLGATPINEEPVDDSGE